MNAAHRTAEQEEARMQSVRPAMGVGKTRPLTDRGRLNRYLFILDCAMHPVRRGHMSISDVVLITARGM